MKSHTRSPPPPHRRHHHHHAERINRSPSAQANLAPGVVFTFFVITPIFLLMIHRKEQTCCSKQSKTHDAVFQEMMMLTALQ
jgi:hypothetical protein